MTNETLEDYLAGDYHQDMEDISQLEAALERTANVFILAQHKEGAWPYLYGQSATSRGSGKVSHGTQAMIAAALARIGGTGNLASGRPARLKLSERDNVRASLDLGIKKLRDELSGKLMSRSFGVNDPVTLSHFADYLDATAQIGNGAHGNFLEQIGEAVKELWKIATFDPRSAVTESNPKKALLRNLPKIQSFLDDADSDDGLGAKPDRLMNAFVPLRITRSVVALERLSRKVRPAQFNNHYHRFFEATLHEQLSYSDIPDSRFDPAELIFCLEGLILIAPDAVDSRLFERVLSVLEAKQDESAHWRPSRPIYATHQGMTMLPVSVEGAVSLMRSIAIKDGNKDFQPLSARAVPMARRFWKWLQARAVRFDASFSNVAVSDEAVRSQLKVGSKFKEGERAVTGWHSEHVNDPEVVHLWDTSQVAEFMLAYREMLQRAIAGRTLRLSGLKINRPARQRPSDPAGRWTKIVNRYEPRLGARNEEQVYRRIGKSFLEPWAAGRETKASSMLLYGPPGTGKSTVGENLAEALGMRMITVTVSDFLGRGGAYVEARAKAIFQTLEAQFDTIILFDEIDTFLLDRDSARYDKQDTLFQFLTPGMLTKINDLHKLRRSIFIVATNYANRIDPAIQRKGRIDQHYLLGLPDRKRRELILRQEMGLKDDEEISDDILKLTVFFGYSDIKATIDDAGGRGVSPEAIEAELKRSLQTPATVGSYLKRIGKAEHDDYDWSDFPFNEFTGLLDLWIEVQKDDHLETMLEKYGKGIPVAECGDFLNKLRAQMDQQDV